MNLVKRTRAGLMLERTAFMAITNLSGLIEVVFGDGFVCPPAGRQAGGQAV
jgi:hypothetical protein